MERFEASTVTKQFKRTFDESSLNELGKATRLCRREREATPYRLMLALIGSFAAGTLDSIADIHRAFNALCGKRFANHMIDRREDAVSASGTGRATG